VSGKARVRVVNEMNRPPDLPGSMALALPPSHVAIVEAAVAVIFPCLIFGSSLVQQPSQVFAAVGQLLLWVAILAAAEIIVVFHPGSTFIILFSLLAMLRAAQLVLGAKSSLSMSYEVVNGLIFLIAGGAVLAFRRRVLERQLKTLFALSVPVMLLQVYGKPAWVQVLRTDAHTFGGGPVAREAMLPSLFESNSGGFNTTQARPAGLLHANNFLSIVLLFAFALHFRRSKGRALGRTDVLLMAVVVLSMAKIGFLAFIAFSLVYLVRGPLDARVRVAKMWGLLFLFLAGFYVLFPGVFLYDLSPNNALLNYAIRVADLRAAVAGASVVDVVQVQGIDGSQLAVAGLEAGTQSGYSAAARFWPYLLVIVALFGVLFYLRLRRLPAEGPDRRDLAINAVLVLLLSPLITSFAGNPFFAFALGGLALPWLAERALANRWEASPQMSVLLTPR
jgi:hypothetical protein